MLCFKMLDICTYVCFFRVQPPPPSPPPPPPPPLPPSKSSTKSKSSKKKKSPGTIVLPPLKRKWAKGSRLAFLTSHLDAYKTCLRRKRDRSSLSELNDTIVREYFRRFDWRLPVDVEPPLPIVPVDPNAPPESLSLEDEAMKAAVIAQMKNVRPLS